MGLVYAAGTELGNIMLTVTSQYMNNSMVHRLSETGGFARCLLQGSFCISRDSVLQALLQAGIGGNRDETVVFLTRIARHQPSMEQDENLRS